MLVDIPLPKGIQSVKGLPRQHERLYNMVYLEGLISRPGVTDWIDGEGACRASFMYQGYLHQVSGTTLIRIASDGAKTTIGTIEGSVQIAVAVDHAAVALVVKGGKGYELKGSTLSQFTTNYVPCDDVAVLDGIFVFVPSDGSPPIFSAVGIPSSIGALSFFDAETLPDLNRGVMNHKNDLYILGEDSAEVFRHSGTDAAPFQRVFGGLLAIGYHGGKVEYRVGGEETFAFVGTERGGGPGIFSPLGRISSASIDEILSDMPQADLRACTGHRFSWKGNDCLIFVFPSRTLSYNGNWSEMGSGFSQQRWIVTHVTKAYGGFVVGTDSGKIGKIADVDTDFGEKFERIIDTFYRAPRDSFFELVSLELDVTITRGKGTLGLSLSRNGALYGPAFYRNVPVVGDYDGRIQYCYPGGLGGFESFAAIRLRSTEAIDFNTDKIWVDNGQ